MKTKSDCVLGRAFIAHLFGQEIESVTDSQLHKLKLAGWVEDGCFTAFMLFSSIGTGFILLAITSFCFGSGGDPIGDAWRYSPILWKYVCYAWVMYVLCGFTSAILVRRKWKWCDIAGDYYVVKKMFEFVADDSCLSVSDWGDLQTVRVAVDTCLKTIARNKELFHLTQNVQQESKCIIRFQRLYDAAKPFGLVADSYKPYFDGIEREIGLYNWSI